MALWAGSAINSTETAMVFNQLYNLKALAIVRKKNGLLYKMLGKMDISSVKPGASTSFQRSQKITGKNIEVKFLGALLTTTKVADGAGEYAVATPAFNANSYGAMEVPLTHYTMSVPVPDSQLLRYKGPEAKTNNFYNEVMEQIMLSYENDWGTDLHSTTSTNLVSRTVLGAWPFWVSTGGGDSGGDATSETGNAYRYVGTIDRQDSANADLRGIVTASYGSSTLGKLRGLANQVDANGGSVDTVVMGTSLYTTHQLLVEPFTYITNASDMVDFGGKYFRYDGMDFMHDQRCPAATIGGLDSSKWLVVQNSDTLTTAGLIPNPSWVASHVIVTGAWMQTIALQPNCNFKALAAT